MDTIEKIKNLDRKLTLLYKKKIGKHNLNHNPTHLRVNALVSNYRNNVEMYFTGLKMSIFDSKASKENILNVKKQAIRASEMNLETENENLFTKDDLPNTRLIDLKIHKNKN